MLTKLNEAPVIILGTHGHAKASAATVMNTNDTEEPGTDPSMEMPISAHLKDDYHVYFLKKQPNQPYPEKVLLGRSPGNDIVVKNQTVSRVQASFQQSNDSWWIYDLGATNGTFVNGRKLGANMKAVLRSDDCIAFGPKIFGFYFTHQHFRELLDETR